MARDHDSGAAAAALAAGASGTVLGTAALRPAVERAFLRRTKADWRTLLRGTGSARMRALRRLASWKGLKNTNMSLGGLLAKGPIGRRFAVLGALAATALGGLGLKKLLSRD